MISDDLDRLKSVLAAASALDASPVPTKHRKVILCWLDAQRLGLSRAKFDALPDVGYGLKMMEGA